MALREDLLPVFEGVRQLVQDFGLRQSRVWIRTGDWDGGELLLGDLENTDVELLPRPKVEQQPGGMLKITRLTPSFDGGGILPASLSPAVAVGSSHRFLVAGPDGNVHTYRLASINLRKNFGYELMLEQPAQAEPDINDYNPAPYVP
jgi:hypothetical protein